MCLSWGEQFLKFIRLIVSEAPVSPHIVTSGSDRDGGSGNDTHGAESSANSSSAIPSSFNADQGDESVKIWRVKFVPTRGIEVWLLDQAGVETVRDGEDRYGFLPRWFSEVVTGKIRTLEKTTAGGNA